MKSFSRQRGMGVLGFLLFVLILGGITYLVFQIAPIYMEHYSLQRVLNSSQTQAVLQKSGNLSQATTDIRNYFARDFRVNNIVDVPLNNIQLTPVSSGYQIAVWYQVRKNIVGNLDVIVTFNDQVVVGIS